MVKGRQRLKIETTLTSPATHYAANKPGTKIPGFFMRIGPKVQRNEPCPCGSGIKFKSCCKTEIELLRVAKADYDQNIKDQADGE